MDFIYKCRLELLRYLDWGISKLFDREEILIKFYALVSVAIARAKAANNYFTLFGVQQFPHIISRRRGICYFVLFGDNKLSQALFDFYDVIHHQQKAVEPQLVKSVNAKSILTIDEIRRQVIIDALIRIIETMPSELSSDVEASFQQFEASFKLVTTNTSS